MRGRDIILENIIFCVKQSQINAVGHTLRRREKYVEAKNDEG